MLKIYRSLRTFIASIALSAMAFVIDTVERCLAKFELTVSAVVAKICQVGHSLKTGVYSFSVKTAESVFSACNGFVSLRRSLDRTLLD